MREKCTEKSPLRLPRGGGEKGGATGYGGREIRRQNATEQDKEDTEVKSVGKNATEQDKVYASINVS